MSTHYLAVFPEDPDFVPDAERIRQALQLYEIDPDQGAPVLERVDFIQGMQNFDGVECPFCGADLDDWWGEAMSRAWDQERNRFGNLDCRAPCCGADTSLNNLAYRSPAGFARFVLNIPGGLSDEEHAQLEALLGCRLRQTWVHI